LTLNAQEQRVNAMLMSAKLQTYDNCFDQMCFPPARHFFDAKSDIESSEVFRLIKRMPKGEMQKMLFAECVQLVNRNISIGRSQSA
jgi:Adenosine/AMP deaminase N-terminal